MEHELKRFQIQVLRKSKDSTGVSTLWVDDGSEASPTLGEILAKLVAMLDTSGDDKSKNTDVLAFFLCCDGEKLISIPMLNNDKKFVRWSSVTFHSPDRDLLTAMISAFPGQKATLKKIALDDALGL